MFLKKNELNYMYNLLSVHIFTQMCDQMQKKKKNKKQEPQVLGISFSQLRRKSATGFGIELA
jgi:hypothetical protein